MFFKIVVLKNFAKFTGMHVHRSLFLTHNLQLYWKKSCWHIYFSANFSKMFRSTLSYYGKTSCELVLKGELYKKWRIDILIITRDIVKSTALPKNRGKVYKLFFYIRIFYKNHKASETQNFSKNRAEARLQSFRVCILLPYNFIVLFSVPVYCPSEIWNFSFQCVWN